MNWKVPVTRVAVIVSTVILPLPPSVLACHSAPDSVILAFDVWGKPMRCVAGPPLLRNAKARMIAPSVFAPAMLMIVSLSVELTSRKIMGFTADHAVPLIVALRQALPVGQPLVPVEGGNRTRRCRLSRAPRRKREGVWNRAALC